ncbi:MAG: hypothetical protein KDA75_03800 [Planctomycetaceae bacterium]|nr:hypothetical protein [Planctomycetaceae bacterium]
MIAVKDGYGFAHTAGLYLEATGRLEAEMRARFTREIAARFGSFEEHLQKHFGPRSNVLQLVADDTPIRGRIVDIEGSPVAGARVQVHGVLERRNPKQSWDDLLSADDLDSFQLQQRTERVVEGPRGVVAAPAVETDADGWFTLHGIGAGRNARIVVTGPTVEATDFYARTSAGDKIGVPHDRSRPEYGERAHYPAEFTIALGPSQPVEGVIRDVLTQAPIPNCVLDAQAVANRRLSGESDYIRAVTDAAGHYRLEGLPPGRNSIRIRPPGPTGYMDGAFDVTTGRSDQPLTHNETLYPGVRIGGRVSVRSSGEPVYASVQYVALPGSPNLEPARSYLRTGMESWQNMTDREGRFAINVLPGRGVLRVVAANYSAYAMGVGAEEVTAAFSGEKAPDGVNAMRVSMLGLQPQHANLVQLIDVNRDTPDHALELQLEQGEKLRIQVRDELGQPPGRLIVSGESNRSGWQAIEGNALFVEGYFPEQGRRVMACDLERNLAAYRDLTGEQPPEIMVDLAPAGIIRGRVLDEQGDPLADATLHNESPSISDPSQSLPGPDPQQGSIVRWYGEGEVRTDDEGRFELRGIIPGLKYSVGVTALRRFHGEDQSVSLGTIFENVTVEPGETKDLGDLRPGRAIGAASTPVAVAKPEADNPTTKAEDHSHQPTNSDHRTSVTLTGIVLKPDGAPAAGATIRSAARWWDWLQSTTSADYRPPVLEATADSEGRFTLTLPFGPDEKLTQSHAAWQKVWEQPRWQQLWKQARIAASLPGHGAAWAKLSDIEDEPTVTFTLVDDLPIRGRLIDLEGRALADVTVALGNAVDSKHGSLDAWLAAVAAGEPAWTAHQKAGDSVDPELIGVSGELKTDAEGRFEIHGLGRERYVELVVSGEHVARRGAVACTRDMEPISRTIVPSFSSIEEPVFGAEFEMTADPARLVEGVVTDAETGNPLPGVSVESYKLAGYPFANHRVIRSVSDADGRFRLAGVPKGEGNILLAVPNDEQPYLMRRVEVPDPVGLGPAEVAIELHHGVWITGRVTDLETGAGVPGCRLHYLPYRANPFAQALPEYDSDGNVDGDQMRYTSDAEGWFRIVGLPGKAVVGVEAIFQSYRFGVGYDQLTGPRYGKSDWINTYRNPINPSPKWPSTMREVDIPQGADEFPLDFDLDPGASVQLKIVDTDGQPVTGVDVQGLAPRGGRPTLHSPEQLATNFGPDETRSIVVRHNERRIGRVIRVGPDEVAQGTVTVALEPFATLTGRLLLDDETPATGLTLRPDLLPGGDFVLHLPAVATDAEGRFEVDLIPGCNYSVLAEGKGLDAFAMVVKDLAITAGEDRNLGELILAKREFRPQTSELQASAADRTVNDKPAASATESRVTIAGHIQSSDGATPSGVPVAAIGWRLGELKQGLYDPQLEVLGESTTEADGSYSLLLDGVTNASHRNRCVVARGPSTALAWKEFLPGPDEIEVDLTLSPDQPLRLKLIDIDGQPADGVQVSIDTVLRTASTPQNWNAVRIGEGISTSIWPQPVTTDAEGRCVLHGIAADCGVSLSIPGSDRFAPQSMTLNSGQAEQRPDNDATYRPQIRNVAAGEEAVLPLAPAQTFAGLVTFGDTGEPAPAGKVGIWASQQEYGSMITVNGSTGEHGRYYITPHPGIRFGVTAHAPAGTPYLARQIQPIIWEADESPNEVNVELPRGVLVRGKVLEMGSGDPIAGANVQYLPKNSNPFDEDGIITGWQAIVESAEDGAFEIAVLPGRGTLIVHGGQDEYVLREMTSRQIDLDRPGGRRYYAHAFVPLDLPEAGETQDLTIQLEPGRKVSGRLVDEAGEPIERALMVTRLKISPAHLSWQGFEREVIGGRFELASLPADDAVPCSFLEPERMLGATAMVSGDEPEPTITLRPCGSAKLRMVDPDGRPLAGRQTSLNIVASPGCPRYEFKVQERGEVAADEDHNANVDRKNYWDREPSGEDGVIELPALIPGATYRIYRPGEGFEDYLDFTVESGEVRDLGDFVVSESE